MVQLLCFALLSGVHILTAALLPGVSWPQTPSLFLYSPHTIMGTKWNGHSDVMLGIWSPRFTFEYPHSSGARSAQLMILDVASQINSHVNPAHLSCQYK